jgi:hypothetical protein
MKLLGVPLGATYRNYDIMKTIEKWITMESDDYYE